jgi:peptidoglycan/LPS O-acetylase OafA/YrhL
MSKIIHLKGLNGLRAIAALAVVISHTALSLSNFGLIDTIFGIDKNGNPKGLLLASYGVSIFFALSGFLITFLLLKEKEKTNKINIKKFYIRRALRIWPLYYFYLILIFIVYYIYNVPFNATPIPFYIFLMANVPIITNNMLPFAGHLWSIGVEEQFYFFWPWIVKTRNDKLLMYSVFLVIFLFSLKILFWLLNYKYNIAIPLRALSVTRIHIMIIGAIGAILYYNKSNLTRVFTSKWLQLFSWMIILLVGLNKFHIASVIDNEIIGVIIGVITVFIIFGQITRTNYVINLENKVMNFIGKISYGIYVYHPLIIFLTYKTIKPFENSTLQNYLFIFTLIISLTIGIAYVSYTYFENKFIKLKSKFAIINTKA